MIERMLLKPSIVIEWNASEDMEFHPYRKTQRTGLSARITPISIARHTPSRAIIKIVMSTAKPSVRFAPSPNVCDRIEHFVGV